MKRKICAMGLMAALLVGTSVTVYAQEEIPVVEFTQDEEFQMDDLTLDQFKDMLPGDTQVQKIEIVNNSEKEVNFFISQETVEEVKQANSASGGTFTYSLAVGNSVDGSDAVSLLDKEIGGMNSQGEAQEAFAGMDDLKEYAFLTKLSPKQNAYIFLTLKIDGEQNDNRRTSSDEESADNLYGYSNFLASLNISFRAYDGSKVIIDEPEPTIIERVVEVVKTNPYKGGDTTTKVVFTCILVLGAGIVTYSIVRRKKGEKNHA